MSKLITLTFTYTSPQYARQHNIRASGYHLTKTNCSNDFQFDAADNSLSWSSRYPTSFELFEVINPQVIDEKGAAYVNTKVDIAAALESKFNQCRIKAREGVCYLPFKEIGRLGDISETTRSIQTITLVFKSSDPEPFEISLLQLSQC